MLAFSVSTGSGVNFVKRFEVKACESIKPQAAKTEARVHCLLILHSLVSCSFFATSFKDLYSSWSE